MWRSHTTTSGFHRFAAPSAARPVRPSSTSQPRSSTPRFSAVSKPSLSSTSRTRPATHPPRLCAILLGLADGACQLWVAHAEALGAEAELVGARHVAETQVAARNLGERVGIVLLDGERLLVRRERARVLLAPPVHAADSVERGEAFRVRVGRALKRGE